jgi:Txe/YoeB family toxin of toxin-antitoxin system
MGYNLIIEKDVIEDFKKLKAIKLDIKVKTLIDIIKDDPYVFPPDIEYLKGNLKGKISRRINKKHRLVYLINELDKEVILISAWSHYEGKLKR